MAMNTSTTLRGVTSGSGCVHDGQRRDLGYIDPARDDGDRVSSTFAQRSAQVGCTVGCTVAVPSAVPWSAQVRNGNISDIESCIWADRSFAET